ncbi:MAG: DUF2007 domain-containing protein [Candidatus Aminicenantes bacterium]|jgi:Putative prokaryotic signal transducing protein|nr:DUF2007 domain-containing protein [Candidatus Aminicenantes bacterium]
MDNTDNKKNKNGKDTELKELHKVWGPVEAEIVKGYLESNGIPCIFRGKVVQSVHPFSADGLGEIKIFVAEKDYSRAKELLKKKVGI